MDQKSFDRLSVVVDRLRTGATRRETLRLLLGGSLAAAAAVGVEDAEAKKSKNRNKRRKNGRVCRGKKCWNWNNGWNWWNNNNPWWNDNWWDGNWNGGWDGCHDGSWGFFGSCPSTFTCCGSNAGRGCCPPGMRCCKTWLGGQCCPSGMRCSKNGCTTWRSGGSGPRSLATEPQTPKPNFTKADRAAAEEAAKGTAAKQKR